MASLYYGYSVTSDSLESFLKSTGLRYDLVSKYVRCFKNNFENGQASKEEFNKWAEKMHYNKAGGLSESDSIKIYDALFHR